MIFAELQSLARQQPDAPAIAVRDAVTYAQLFDRARAIGATRWGSGQRIGVWVDDPASLVATLAALDGAKADAVVFSGRSSLETVDHQRQSLGLAAVISDKPIHEPWLTSLESTTEPPLSALSPQGCSPETSQSSPNGHVVLFTSGTSGAPKPARHRWESLITAVHHGEPFCNRSWLLAYDPTKFAGIQVWLQALLTGGCLCVPEAREPASILRCLIEHAVEFVPATPSFWRLLLSYAPASELAAVPLRQITLGGEAVDQPLLDALRAAFPNARITHIYASTEMGVCFAVHDGKAGFPASYLSDERLPCRLRINPEGELEIRSRGAMLGYLEPTSQNASRASDRSASGGSPADDWFPTGDLVQQCDDRILFLGRKSDTINVGGLKVFPSDVESCIREVSGVQQVRVYGVASSLIGQLVAAEVQPAEAVHDQDSLRRTILAACRSKLARHQIPAVIAFSDRVQLNESGKIVRAGGISG